MYTPTDSMPQVRETSTCSAGSQAAFKAGQPSLGWISSRDSHACLWSSTAQSLQAAAVSPFKHNMLFAGVYNSELDPQQGFSCLSVVLNLALAPGQPRQQPLLYEQSLQLLYRLSEQLQTRDAMLTLLRQTSYSMLISQIGEVLPAEDFEQHKVRPLEVTRYTVALT